MLKTHEHRVERVKKCDDSEAMYYRQSRKRIKVRVKKRL